MKNNVIEAKIQIPKVSSNFILRKQLMGRLTDEEKKLFVLHAGVGHGKTVLLTHFAGISEASCAWYHLNASDNDVMTFAQFLCQSIKRVNKNFNFDLPAYEGLLQDEVILENMMLDFAANLSLITQADQKLALIFDDFQEIKSEKIFRFLELLLSYTNENVSIYIATKGTIPSFSMRHMLEGSAEILSNEDFCFKDFEVKEMIEKYSNEIDTEALVKNILESTEGWPAAVMFTLLYIKQNKKSINYSNNKSIMEKTNVNGYLMHEVYKKLPYELQQFLTVTSVLDFLTPGICNEVMQISNSQSMLDYLVQENLLIIKVGNSDNTFRYHSLFRDFLQKGLKEDKKIEILSVATNYYMNSPLSLESREQAVEYAIRSKKLALVQHAMEGIGLEMIRKGKLATMERWIDFLTDSGVIFTSYNMLICGVYHYKKNNISKALECMQRAEEMFISALDEIGYITCMLEKSNMVRNAVSLEESNRIIDQIIPRLKKGNSKFLFEAAQERIYNFIFLCRYEEALAVCSEYILTARRGGDKKTEKQFVELSIIILFYMGKYKKALNIYDNFSEKIFVDTDQMGAYSVDAYAAFMMILYGRNEEAKDLIELALEEKISCDKMEDIWIVYLFKSFIYIFLFYQSRQKDENADTGILKQGIKASMIAVQYTNYFAPNHVFTMYLNSVKDSITIDFNDEPSKTQLMEWMENWSTVYPFARNLSMSFLARGFYAENQKADAVRCCEKILESVFREDIFTVYARAIIVLEQPVGKKKNKVAENEKIIQTYLKENKMEILMLSIQDRKRLSKILKGEVSEVDAKKVKAQISAFGPFEVLLPGMDKTMKWRTKKAQELFAYLFHLQGEGVTKEKILTSLWPDCGDKSGTSLFHTTLYSIRKTLNKNNMENLIVFKDKKYSMNMELLESPLSILQELDVFMQKGELENLYDRQEEIAACKGSYLEDIDCEFCVGSRAYYERILLKLYRKTAKHEMSEKRYEKAVFYLTKALEIDSYAEELFMMLIKCYGALGDVKNAKLIYDKMSKMLKEELDIEPEKCEAELIKECVLQTYNKGGGLM